MTHNNSPKNITALDSSRCTGCLACAHSCPKQAISVQVDNEGFYIPVIEEAKCVDCGICAKKCPQIHPLELRVPQAALAASGKDAVPILNSSSGGIFFLLARAFIQQGGYVCGAILDEKLYLEHRVSCDLADVQKMQGSKYIQSYIYPCFEQIESLLKEGKKVLFCGTPCQVAALRKAIKAPQENLFALDLICHGVPSANAFSEYIWKQYNPKGLVRFAFRNKNKYEANSFSYLFVQQKKGASSLKYRRILSDKDPFYQAFLDGASYRESCYQCQYAKAERVGDITIGDCANWASFVDRFTNKVLSTVLINNEKGAWLFEQIGDVVESCTADYQKEVRMNGQLHAAVSRTDQRDTFYTDLRNDSFGTLKSKYCKKASMRTRVKRFLVWHIPLSTRKKCKKVLKVFIR